MPSTIISTGSVTTSNILYSSDIISIINKKSNLSFEEGLIERITGIVSRYSATSSEHPSDLASKASLIALKKAGLLPSDIDTVIFAAGSPDIITPATANIVCDNLQTNANCFDVGNACNSFLNGLQVASLLVESGSAKLVLVCAGEVTTKSMRYDFENTTEFSEHFTGFTFGDGGAAALVARSETDGFTFFDNKSFPSYWSDAGIFAGGSRNLRDSSKGFFRGDPVKLKNNNKLISDQYSSTVLEYLKEQNLSISDFRFVLTQQVTVKSRELFYEKLGCSANQVVPVIESRGNLTAASLPTQLDAVWDLLNSGDKVLFISIGGGISAGCIIWVKP